MMLFTVACNAQPKPTDYEIAELADYMTEVCPVDQLPEFPRTCTEPHQAVIEIPASRGGGVISGPGEEVITQACTPNFVVKFKDQDARTPPGQTLISFQGVTPFVHHRTGEHVWTFKAAHANKLRARMWCERVCTREHPCKYSVIYLDEDGNSPFPVLDPPIIIDQ
jgi:hypothetical protein